MAISLILEHGPHADLPRAEILRRVRAMVDLLQLKKSDVSFVLTNDETIHELNKNYRGKDKPTDVLAFAMHEGEFGALAGDVLGDVIVSVPTAAKQARAARKDVLSEVTMLLAHGLLHLLGWDHETAAKDKRMRAETSRLCAAAEKASPVARADRATPSAKKVKVVASKKASAASRRAPRAAATPASRRSAATKAGSGTASSGRSKAGAGAALTRKPRARKATKRTEKT